MEQQALAVEALGRDRRERSPARHHVHAAELEPPEERDRVVKVARDRRRLALEDAPAQGGRARVVTPPEMHQDQMPQQLVPEPVQVGARVDRGREPTDPCVERRHLVDRVGERVDGPRVERVPEDRRLGRAHRLVAAARLLEYERVETEHERVPGMVAREGGREVEHLGEPALPEPDEIQALEHHEVARVVAQVLAHRRLRVAGLAFHEAGERLDVAALALALRGRRGARGLRRLPRVREALVQEEADRLARVGERQARIVRVRLAEEVERSRVPAEERLDGAVVGRERVVRGRRHRQPVGVAPHGAQSSRRAAARRAPRRGTRGRAARPTSGRARASVPR